MLADCLRSIYRQTQDVIFEIIVSDNSAETDPANKLLNEFPSLIIVKNIKNLGFGAANNAGAQIASGKYLFFLNNDTILINNAIKILKDFMDSEPSAGVCGGSLFDEDLNPVHSFRMSCPSVFWEINYIFYDRLEKLLYGKDIEFNTGTDTREVGYITGADLMVRHTLWDIIAGFDPNFFMYYEDAEFNLRIKKTGAKIYSVPAARIIHLGGKSFSVKEKQELLSLKSREYYYCKSYSRLYYNIICFLSCFQLRMKLFIEELRGKKAAALFWRERIRVWKLYKSGNSC